MSEDIRVVACNSTGSKVYSPGALLYVINPNVGNGGEGSIEVWGMSRGGRWVGKWENVKRLTNFRVKTIPPEHPKFTHLSLYARTPEMYPYMLEMLKKATE